MHSKPPVDAAVNMSTSQSVVQPAPGSGQSSRSPVETPASGPLPSQAVHDRSEKKKLWHPPSNKSVR